MIIGLITVTKPCDAEVGLGVSNFHLPITASNHSIGKPNTPFE